MDIGAALGAAMAVDMDVMHGFVGAAVKIYIGLGYYDRAAPVTPVDVTSPAVTSVHVTNASCNNRQ